MTVYLLYEKYLWAGCPDLLGIYADEQDALYERDRLRDSEPSTVYEFNVVRRSVTPKSLGE